MTVKIFCHTQVEKGTRAYPKLVMKNRTKIKACFLLTTSYRLLAQHLKDGVIFQDDEVPSQIAQDYVLSRCWWLRTPKLTEYLDLLYESLKTLDAVSPTVHRICWCIELGTAPKKLAPNLRNLMCLFCFKRNTHEGRLSIFCSILFRQDWKAGWEKALSIECYARISWHLPISLRSRQTRGPSGGQKSTATDTVDAERVREIVEFWREKKHKDLLAKDASRALQYFIEDFSWDMPSQLSLILVPACAKIVGPGAMPLPTSKPSRATIDFTLCLEMTKAGLQNDSLFHRKLWDLRFEIHLQAKGLTWVGLYTLTCIDSSLCWFVCSIWSVVVFASLWGMDEKLPSKHVPVLKSTPHHACLLHMFNQFVEQAWLEWHKQSLVVPTWAVVWWTCYWYPAKNTSHSRHVVVMYIVPFWLAQFTWVCCQCEQTHSSSIRLERHVMSTVSWTLAICWVWFTRILGGSWKCAAYLEL